MKKKFTVILFVMIFLCFLMTPISLSHAETSGPILSDYPTPGDGKMPTFFRYLDSRGYSSSAIKGLSSGSVRGDILHSLDFDLPPAILKPSLGLSYSSDGDVSLETTVGWTLTGITEIRRPLDRAHKTYPKDQWDKAEWLVSGPDFSGTLVPKASDPNVDKVAGAPANFVLKTTTPLKVSAQYNSDENVWTIYADTFTYTLKAADDGVGTDAGTALWRVTKMTDTIGNMIDFRYDDDHRIKRIYYGGNSTSTRLVKIEFSHADNSSVRTSARAGHLVVYDKHITLIVVNTKDSSSSSSSSTSSVTKKVTTTTSSDTSGYSRRNAYSLSYSLDNGVDLLQKITHEGETNSVAQILAKFTYSKFNSGAAVRQDAGHVPVSLGESWTRTEKYDRNNANQKNGWKDIYLDSQSGESILLADFNRDGLVDILDTTSDDDGNTTYDWLMTYQSVDHDDRDFDWSDTVDIKDPTLFLMSYNHAGKNSSETPSMIDEYFEKFTEFHALTQIIDVDGDGYLDVIETSLDDDKPQWVVHYGYGTTFKRVEEENPPDWTYTQYGQSLNVYSVPNDDPVTGNVMFKTLMDMNNDGFLDAYHPASGTVYYHSGERGGGWEQNPVILNYEFDAVSRVKHTITTRVNYGYTEACSNTCKAGCAYDHDDSPVCDGQWYECDPWEACYEDCVVDNCRVDEGYHIKYDHGQPVIESNADQFVVDQSKELKAFSDLNGDGLADYIDAAATPWQVYFYNGHGFEDPVEWNAPTDYIRLSNEGYPNIHIKEVYDDDCWIKRCGTDEYIPENGGGKQSELLQMLLDVDSDGLLDLAMSKDLGGVWYKNTGSGFADGPLNLPAWFPRFFATAMGDSYAQYGYDTVSETKTLNVLMDIDHDGAVDSVESNNIKYGNYPKPYLLTKVENNRGGKTEMTYRSQATAYPSGDYQKWQYTPNIRNLGDVITTTDTLTGQTARTEIDYKDGYYADGVFQGFGERTVTQYVNDDLLDKTISKYKLSYDLNPIVTGQKLYTDFNLSFGDKISRGKEPNLSLKFAVENSHVEKGTTEEFYLINKRKVAAYGESKSSKTTTQTYTWDDHGNLTHYEHDGAGKSDDKAQVDFTYVSDFYKRFFRMATKEVTGDDPFDDSGTKSGVYESMEYYYDGNALDGKLTQGLLTKEIIGGVVEKQYAYGSRGELTSAKDVTSDLSVTQTFGFGGVALETQTNGLGHKLTRTIDNQGRVTKIADDNRLAVTTTYDQLGRVTAKSVTGKNGKTYKLSSMSYQTKAPYYTKNSTYLESGTVEKITYEIGDGFGRGAQTWEQNHKGQYAVTTKLYDLRGNLLTVSHPENKGSTFAAPTSLAISSSADILTKSYYDALGNLRETIRDADKKTGSRLVYIDKPFQELHVDESGYQTRLTFDAHHRITKVEQGKPSDALKTTGAKASTTVMSGTTASVVVAAAETGNSDTSRSSSGFAVTAKYAYDAADRLVQYTDGNGVTYRYIYDNAGRLLTVQNSQSDGSFDDWRINTYKGFLKQKSYDDSMAVTTWTYDKAGRVTQMNLEDGSLRVTSSDSLPGADTKQTYTYTYDTGWIGTLSKTTDPTGATEYTYDDLGNISQTKRTYDGTDISTTFAYDYDLKQVIKTTLPSGRVLDSTYAYGILTDQSSTTSGTTDYTLAYDYNQWDLLKSITSNLGHKQKITQTTPLWQDQVAFGFGTKAYTRDFTWYENGLLKTKSSDDDANSITGLSVTTMSGVKNSSVQNLAVVAKKTGSETVTATGTSPGMDYADVNQTRYNYYYDDLKNITQIKIPTLDKTIENYAYDNAGALTTMIDSDGKTWTYTLGKELNRVAVRSLGAYTETYGYDNAGRVAEIEPNTGESVLHYDSDGKISGEANTGTTNYYYDALGRLHGVAKDGVVTLVLDYDAQGNLVRQADANPATGSANFIFSHQGWRYDTKVGVVTETDNDLVVAENGTRRWLFREHDGHATMTFDDSGTVVSNRTLGAYGVEINATGTTWKLNSFHGAEQQNNLFHMGQRHVMQKDGTWLQPEPLLYMGIPIDKLTDPLSLAPYRYARNAPTHLNDTSGFETQTGTSTYAHDDTSASSPSSSDAPNPFQRGTGLNYTTTSSLAPPPLPQIEEAESNQKTNGFSANGFRLGDERQSFQVTSFSLSLQLNQNLGNTSVSGNMLTSLNSEGFNVRTGEFFALQGIVPLGAQANAPSFGVGGFSGFTVATPGMHTQPQPSYFEVNMGIAFGIVW